MRPECIKCEEELYYLCMSDKNFAKSPFFLNEEEIISIMDAQPCTVSDSEYALRQLLK